MEIKEYTVYTTEEARKILKISPSTMKRLLKKGILRANKIGGQYRILGKELLRLLSPTVEKKASVAYKKVKTRAIDIMQDW